MEENKDLEENKTTEENKKEKKGLWGRIKQSGFYRSLNTFASSAIIGLGITLIIFVYKVYSGKKQFEETAKMMRMMTSGGGKKLLRMANNRRK